MAISLSTPITKSPVPAAPKPATPGQQAALLKLFGGKSPLAKAPTVSTSHPALEPTPGLPKIPAPAYGGASSRAPKTTTGLEPHAKLPNVPAPSSTPRVVGSPVAGGTMASPQRV